MVNWLLLLQARSNSSPFVVGKAKKLQRVAVSFRQIYPRVDKNRLEDSLEGCVYNGQHSILKG